MMMGGYGKFRDTGASRGGVDLPSTPTRPVRGHASFAACARCRGVLQKRRASEAKTPLQPRLRSARERANGALGTASITAGQQLANRLSISMPRPPFCSLAW